MVTLSTNALGNASFAILPYFLNSSGNTMFGINNDATLTGSASSNQYLGVNIGQSIPTMIYSQYRLVSGGVQLLFTSSAFTSSGLATIGLDYNKNVTIATAPTFAIANFLTYGTFSNIDNCYFRKTIPISNGAILSLPWLPKDVVNEQSFTQVEQSALYSPIIAGYVTGAPASAVIARIRVVLNFEAVVDVSYVDYIPTTETYSDITDFNQSKPMLIQAINDPKLCSERIEDSDLQLEDEPIYLNMNKLLNKDKVTNDLFNFVVKNTLNENDNDKKLAIIKSVESKLPYGIRDTNLSYPIDEVIKESDMDN